MLRISVPIYAAGCGEDDDEYEVFAKMCRNYGNSHLLKDYHGCPVRGIDDKNSLLDCPFSGRMHLNCSEINALDWRSIVCGLSESGSLDRS